jgi:hypothetical protein
MLMTKIGRIIGGILAIAGGSLTTLSAVAISPMLPSYPLAVITFALTIGIGILAIVGGILLLLDKTIGGIFAIVAGALLIIGAWIDLAPGIPLMTHLTMVIGIGFYIDPLLAICGGIVGLVVGKKS